MFSTKKPMKNIALPILLVFGLIVSSCQSTEKVLLTDLDYTAMTSGWRTSKKDMSVTESQLSINGTVYDNGIGTHATSTMLLELNGKAKSFEAIVGVDDNAGEEASIRFYVIGDGEILWQSSLMKFGMDGEKCEVDLKGIKRLGLLVDDAGDGIGFDHADWVSASLTYVGEVPYIAGKTKEEPYILTPPAPDQPRVNGPKIIGVRPGSPFIYRIPATGKGKLFFAANNLPDGLTLNQGERVIRGSIAKTGVYQIELVAQNDFGRDTRELTIKVGDTLALTPHMGWNSWYIHYARVSDAIMREAADQMISTGMADYGYRYVNIDDCWMIKENSDDPEIGGPLRNSQGVLNTNRRFPDMKAMTDYIHDKGLLAGTYISPGPFTCARYAGSFEHEALDAKTFSEWGFDFLKYDWCSYGSVMPAVTREDYIAPYALMWNELKKQKRDIVLNLCQYGMNQVWEWGGNVGNSWRTTGDLGLQNGGSMPGFYYIGRSNADHWEYAKPGNWNDPDYILIGWVGSAHQMGEGVPTDLTPSEQYAYMTMWSLMAAPLIFSGDMAKLDEFTLNVLCNHEVIDVNQDILGQQGKIIRETDSEMVMLKHLADGSMAVGLFHVTGSSDSPASNFDWGQKEDREITLSWSEIGLEGKHTVRDLWRQTDLGDFDEGITLTVPWHGAQMIKIN